jgi:hypothetical protein
MRIDLLLQYVAGDGVKLQLSLVAAVDQALKGLKVWVIFPVYPQSLESWLNLKSLVRQLPENYAEVREVEKRIVLSNGGSIQIKSANKPETLKRCRWYISYYL